jgi:signal transduction histidine kinase
MELKFQNEEKVKLAADLLLANIELHFQNEGKENHARDLFEANLALKKQAKIQQEHIVNLEKMIHMVSHEVRQPITQLMGLSNLLKNLKTSKSVARIHVYINDAIANLDKYTRYLTKYLSELVNKGRGVN